MWFWKTEDHELQKLKRNKFTGANDTILFIVAPMWGIPYISSKKTYGNLLRVQWTQFYDDIIRQAWLYCKVFFPITGTHSLRAVSVEMCLKTTFIVFFWLIWSRLHATDPNLKFGSGVKILLARIRILPGPRNLQEQIFFFFTNKKIFKNLYWNGHKHLTRLSEPMFKALLNFLMTIFCKTKVQIRIRAIQSNPDLANYR